MENEITNEATVVVVPHAEASTVDLKEVQQRVREELTRFKEELGAAGDPILAGNISTSSEARLEVIYHDLDTIQGIPGWDKLSPEQKLDAAYGHQNSNAFDEAKEGREIFSILDGRICDISKGEPVPSSATDFNAVLQKIADQHKWLLQQRVATSAVGVTAPTIAQP